MEFLMKHEKVGIDCCDDDWTCGMDGIFIVQVALRMLTDL